MSNYSSVCLLQHVHSNEITIISKFLQVWYSVYSAQYFKNKYVMLEILAFCLAIE